MEGAHKLRGWETKRWRGREKEKEREREKRQGGKKKEITGLET